jgi:hypothetical protein
MDLKNLALDRNHLGSCLGTEDLMNPLSQLRPGILIELPGQPPGYQPTERKPLQISKPKGPHARTILT